jgi:phosphoserine phosphatase RsbU/P
MNFDPGLILGLVGQACLVVIAVYIISRTKLFDSILNRKLSSTTQIILAIIFGVLAIYGTYAGIKTSGAIANIRNMGPMVAGLIGGPWVGLGAGLIGGLHRFFIGGFTAVPCAIGTTVSGLAAGILYWALKGKIGIWKPILYAFIMECVDMGLILLIARPFSNALDLVKVIAAPMIIGDTAGIAIFAFMLSSILKDKKLI